MIFRGWASFTVGELGRLGKRETLARCLGRWRRPPWGESGIPRWRYSRRPRSSVPFLSPAPGRPDSRRPAAAGGFPKVCVLHQGPHGVEDPLAGKVVGPGGFYPAHRLRVPLGLHHAVAFLTKVLQQQLIQGVYQLQALCLIFLRVPRTILWENGASPLPFLIY